MKPSFFSILFICLSACSQGAGQLDSSSTANALAYGTLAPNYKYPVGKISYSSPTNQICTGTMVGSRTILTAAHCLGGSPGSPISINTVIPSTYYYVQFQTSTSYIGPYQSSSIYLFGKDEYNDVALITLSSDVSPLVGYYNLSDNQSDIQSSNVSVFGYGRDPANSGSIGSRQTFTAPAFTADDASPTDLKSSLIEISVDSNGGNPAPEVCDGDSGGPVFKQGQDLVAGVIYGSGGGSCSAPSYAVRVDRFAAQIRPLVYTSAPTSSNPGSPTIFQLFQKIPNFLMYFLP